MVNNARISIILDKVLKDKIKEISIRENKLLSDVIDKYLCHKTIKNSNGTHSIVYYINELKGISIDNQLNLFGKDDALKRGYYKW